jgi:DNA repair protein RecN (Recombination protein N)
MLEEAARTDPDLGEAATSVVSAAAALEDALRSLRRYLDGLEADPERLALVEERLDALRRLARKHATDVAGLPGRLEALRIECERLEGRRERLVALDAERSAAEAQAWEAARSLRRERERAARQIERAVGSELGRLALPRATFTVQLAPRDVLRADGADEVEFLFGANPGEPARPLARVASGGEASRLWLALKRMSMARGGPEEAATVVLDEADAGVSGAVADVVGRMVRAVASGRQVLCITHLPQVAAHADAHMLVEKTSSRGRTWSSVRVLDAGAPRTRELARMLSGAIVTSEALAAAEALVRAARESAAPPGAPKLSRARRVA